MPDEVAACGLVPAPDPELLEKTAALLQVVAHPVRVHVLYALAREGPLTAGELQERVQVEASALSHHLRLMRDARSSGPSRGVVTGSTGSTIRTSPTSSKTRSATSGKRRSRRKASSYFRVLFSWTFGEKKKFGGNVIP